MNICTQISQIKQFIAQERALGKSIGFVPTMGALHQGHISLVEAAAKENDITVCSIYINPEQFNNADDLAKYPKDLENDLKMLVKAGCQAVFCPNDAMMYQSKPFIKISFGPLEQVMEGLHRAGHFSGVAIIVAKLFHIIKPDSAYFGQKDLQQFRIIAQLVEDLSFDIRLKEIPILREENGLAMSSRNRRLNENEREAACIFYKSLIKAKDLLLEGKQPFDVKNCIQEVFEQQQLAKLEYFEIVNKYDLHAVEQIDSPKDIALCIAGYIGNVRLIDNMYLIS